MKEIVLTQGKMVLVDDEDFGSLNIYKWAAHFNPSSGIWYAENAKIKMHRFILKALPNQEVHHLDRNGLNNQRSNLLLCTREQHKHFEGPRKGAEYKGIYYRPDRGTYYASISVKHKSIHLGSFNNKKEAALAYNQAALEYFGPSAYFNQVF
jgi:hypothetical protein